ncbi:hypothetical protein SAMN05421741_1445 [Paenimyroides ummariense]|uniref:Nitrogen regulatory IIA protein n=1 Tax=Paenimyroides ummariense TaxID=913024 RepID=A0A1I5GKS2_9FLAO|nr:hypothetical protein [Paenimyroides ummariense]SFO36543.1 hypothetical protein SAMN05421741_1445 [Paenimyroides ummariense]
MKKLKESTQMYFDKIDNRWKRLSLKKQHQYLITLFIGYLLLTISVIFKIWYDTESNETEMQINHIENPVMKNSPYKDSLNHKIKNLLINDDL